jgi:hypothetical protein
VLEDMCCGFDGPSCSNGQESCYDFYAKPFSPEDACGKNALILHLQILLLCIYIYLLLQYLGIKIISKDKREIKQVIM